MVIYEKVMTRDAPLVIVEAWCKCFTQSLPAITGIRWPIPLFIFRDGAVESHRPQKYFHQEFPLKLAEQLKKPEVVLKILHSFDRYYECAKKLKNKKLKNVSALEALTGITKTHDLFVEGAAGLICGYWCVEWNKGALNAKKEPLFPREITELAIKLRAGDTLMEDAIEAVYGYLDSMAEKERWPQKLMKFLTMTELSDAIQRKQDFDLKILSEREKGYAYVEGKVIPAIELPAFLNKNNYKIENMKVKAIDTIKGTPAFPGIVRGIVRIVFNREQIIKVCLGDILVAPMTTPWYLPAMEKAAAFVTDEGGILCHAAIIAREMKKPCVIGTKVATKVLQDNEMVEVDASKGIIKKI